ncbi:MAG: class II fructose-bisphosphate aldolase, partial [Patescibacteria group bacterium]
WATGHFNASTLEQMRVICSVCKELGSPAVIGTSEGEREHIGLHEAVALRQALRHEFNILVFLNADHSKSVESVKTAIDAGYDSIHIDLSALPFEENARWTREVVEYAKRPEAEQARYGASKAQSVEHKVEISVEGELGYLRGESKIQKEKIEVKAEDLTNPGEAREFVEKTGVDRLAMAVGNIHGLALDEPALDIERIRAIRKAVLESCSLVLHAGSGIPDDQIRAAIQAGIANIHINTDIRIAFTKGLREHLTEHPEETTPYKLFPEAEEAMAKVVREKLELFGAVNKI